MKNISKTFYQIFVSILFLSVFSMSGNAQSFILNLQYNPMSFTNAHRTVLVDPGSDGGISAGSIHKYTNVITKDGIVVYALLTVVETNNANITMFDDDIQNGESTRFQPRIGAGSGGGYILYQLEFFDTADDDPVFIYDYYVTGVDVDGNGSNKEYAEYSGYNSYQVNNPTQLSISTNNTTGRTRFTGRSSSLSGITFDNTCSYIVNYSNPNNIITFAIGQTSSNYERYNSVQFGAAGGVFSIPEVVSNPLPIAVDDIGTPVVTGVGGVAVVDVLDNDSYDDSPISSSACTISLVTAASDAGIVLNVSTGEVTVAPTTPEGTYTLRYKICMNASSNDCDEADVSIEVSGTGIVENYFPAGGFGTLAFEDMWPSKSDYDFNDLVLDYRFKILSDVDNKVNNIEATFVIKAFGASHDNGFGFQLGSALNQVDFTSTGQSMTESYISLGANGLENGQTNPTFIVFDNAYNEMTHPGMGIGVNTEANAPFVSPDTIVLLINVGGSYDLADINIAQFNPFLIVNQDRGIEVHLPNKAPTDLADQALLGTSDDDSNAGIDRFYKTAQNLPWAINIYESFVYPNEKVEISDAHLKFIQWAQSNGISFSDWYKNLPGYRNNENVYVAP